MDSLDFEGRQKPWYKKKKFWLIAGPLLVSFAFILAVRRRRSCGTLCPLHAAVAVCMRRPEHASQAPACAPPSH